MPRTKTEEIDFDSLYDDAETDKPQEAAQPKLSKNPFGSNFDPNSVYSTVQASARTSAQEMQFGQQFSFPQIISVGRTGFDIDIPYKTDEGKTKRKKRTISNDDAPIYGMIVNLGDGKKIEEDNGYFNKTQVFVNQAQQKVLQAAIDALFGPGVHKIPRVVSSYGNCSGGIVELQNMNTDIWDQLVRGLHNQAEEFREFWENNAVVWDKNNKGKDVNPPVFKMADGSQPHKKYFFHLENIETVPHVRLDPIPSSCSGRVFRITSWPAQGFILFRAALGICFANYQGVDATTVLRGSMEDDFEEWFRTLPIEITIDSVESSDFGSFLHPKFFVPVKEALGMGLWEAMQTKNFAVAMNPKLTPRQFAADRLEDLWVTMAGRRYVRENTCPMIKEGKKDPRKRR